MNHHEGVQCDICMKDRFEGGRYKCLRCHDYDLCADCFDANASSGNHLSSHPMQIVCSMRDMALYFGGESIDGPCTISLTCSYCGEMGFEPAALMTHLINLHGGEPDVSTPVLCPICVRRPHGNVNYVTTNLPGHFAVEHQIPAPRHLVSSFDALAMTALRNPPAASRSTLRGNSTYAQGNRNTMDAFLFELMSHLPEVSPLMQQRAENLRESQHQSQNQSRQERRQLRQQRDYNHLAAHRAFGDAHLTPEEQILLADGPPPTPPRTTSSRVSFGRGSSRASTVQTLESIMLGPSIQRLHAGFGRGQSLSRSSATLNLDFASTASHDRGQHDGVFIESERNADWLPMPGAISGEIGAANGPSCSNASGTGRAPKSTRTQTAPKASKTNNSFLLRTLFNPTISEEVKAGTDLECADRSLFVQALLLSAMSKDQEFAKQSEVLLDDEGTNELKHPTRLDTKLKKKNKRRKKGCKTYSTCVENASQISSQHSQDDP